MTVSVEAFRFNVGETQYAIDIHLGLARLYVQTGPGRFEQADFPPFNASNDAIQSAGGPVNFVNSLIDALNAILRTIQGKPRPEDVPASTDLAGKVLAYMRANVVTHTLMDGTVQLRVR